MLKYLILIGVVIPLYFYPIEILVFLITTLTIQILLAQLNCKIELIHHAETSLHPVLSSCKSLTTYTPPLFLFNGFLQGFYGITLGSKPGKTIFCDAVEYERKFLTLPDKGQISIDWLVKQGASKILIVAAGLGADSNSQSSRCVAMEGFKQGFTVAVVHGRGISCPLTTPKVFNLCVWKDYAFTIDAIAKEHPSKALVALGMSMGGAILAKYASKTGTNCKLRALATVGSPFDSGTSAKYLKSKWNYFGLFDSMILTVLKMYVKNKLPEFMKWEKEFKDMNIDFDEVMNTKDVSDFDDKFTARMVGVKGFNEYYYKGSSGRGLGKVRIPMIALHAADDPIVNCIAAPKEEFRNNKNLVLALTKTGGHVGFFKGMLPPKRWFQVPCIEFLNQSLQLNPTN